MSNSFKSNIDGTLLAWAWYSCPHFSWVCNGEWTLKLSNRVNIHIIRNLKLFYGWQYSDKHIKCSSLHTACCTTISYHIFKLSVLAIKRKLYCKLEKGNIKDEFTESLQVKIQCPWLFKPKNKFDAFIFMLFFLAIHFQAKYENLWEKNF